MHLTANDPVQFQAPPGAGDLLIQSRRQPKGDRQAAVRMRLKAAIMKYQTEKGTQAIPPFMVLWESGYLGTKGSQDEFMAAYTSAVMAMMRA